MIDFLGRVERQQKLWTSPLIIKPTDGAGSEGIRVVDNLGFTGQRKAIMADSLSPQQDGNEQIIDFDLSNAESINDLEITNYMVEPMIQGTSMSVSVLCGKGKFELLPPTIQLFDDSPIGHYVGTGYPVDAELSRRALSLADEVMRLLPETRGYIGLDLVIGAEADPDCFIEVNPRLTMSYLKLREIVAGNLAMRMFELVRDCV